MHYFIREASDVSEVPVSQNGFKIKPVCSAVSCVIGSRMTMQWILGCDNCGCQENAVVFRSNVKSKYLVFRFPKFRFPVGLPVFKYRLAPNLGPQKESHFRDQRENWIRFHGLIKK